MKRKLSFVTVMLLVLAMVFSFAACKDGGGTTDGDNTNKKVVPEAQTQTDTREAVYEAFTADGTSLGMYKTIAAAINAAVASDEEALKSEEVTAMAKGEYNGGYVLGTDGETIIFRNHNGFAAGSDDMFWFYDNGSELVAYDCYGSDFYSDLLKNSTLVTNEVTTTGSVSKQFHNGYALYNPDGTLNTDSTTAAASWELSSTMDAAALMMPARLKGVTGMSQTIDLTNVQITPNYEGTDDTYAYIGYYTWEDYYVIVTGIACNVQTGAWYKFEGTSRDDSFSDMEYNIGDPVMISTWNEEGGYWTPEYATLKMTIGSELKTDELGDFAEDTAVYEFYKADGTLDNTVTFTINEEDTQKYFNAACKVSNTFAFICGLDIRTETSTGVYCKQTDYFNGAEFKNLKVTEASVHIYGDPENADMSLVEYGYDIFPEWIGQDFNILMASGDHEVYESVDEKTGNVVKTPVYDYTILNCYAFASYEAVDGADVYSFSYAGSPVSENITSGKLAEYQAQIDELKNVTMDNALEYGEKIEAVKAMKGTDGTASTSSIEQKYWNLLDFSPLTTAQDTYAKVASLSEAGEAFKTAVNALPELTSYVYVGWSTTEADDTGYLANDVADFTALYNQYASSLTDTDWDAWQYHVTNIDSYNMYVDLMEKLNATGLDNVSISAKAFGVDEAAVTYTGTQAYEQIIYALNRIANGTAWSTDTENDDPNGGAVKVLNSDNNWLPSYHVLYLAARLEEAGYELPTYAEYLMETKCGVQSGLLTDFAYIDSVLTIASMMENGEASFVNATVVEYANKAIVGFDGFDEAGLAWNWNDSGAKDFHYRSKLYKAYYGLETGTDLADYIAKVIALLVKGGATANASGLGVESAVTEQEVTVTEEAQAVITLYDAVVNYADYTSYDAANAAYDALTLDTDKELVNAFSDRETIVETVEAQKNAMAALDLTAVTETLEVYRRMTVGTKAYDKQTETMTLTASEALSQLNYIINKVQSKVAFVNTLDGYSDYVEADYSAANKGTLADWDNATYVGIRVCVLYDYFKENNVTLPAYMQTILADIGFEAFYESYQSIYQTIRLASTYAAEGKTVADMTEEDRAIFEKYWGPDYSISSLISWNWNSGAKFETYYSERVRAVALQYQLDSGDPIGEEFRDTEAITDNWNLSPGITFAEYSYNGTIYYAYYYEDQCAQYGGVMGHLYSSYWVTKDSPVYLDADGKVTTEVTENILTVDTAGVEVVMRDGYYAWQKVAGDSGGKLRYRTAEDGMNVYKIEVTDDEGNVTESYYVDARGVKLDTTKYNTDNIVEYHRILVYKFYDVLASWLEGQGYTINSNGWGYSAAPTTTEA